MTARTTAFLKALFETSDVPTSADYTDVFDSFVNVSDFTAQSISSDLVFLGDTTLTVTQVTASSITVNNRLSAETVSADQAYVSALRQSIEDAVSAQGSTIGSAYALTRDISVVNTVTSAANEGVRLADGSNQRQLVFNRSASLLRVYPSSVNAQIDALGSGNAFRVTAGESYNFLRLNSNLYLSSK